MQNALLTKFIQKNQRTDTPVFRPGDTIRVHVKIKEGDKERLQAFEGTVIARNNTGLGESITVRKVSFGQGVERIFPIHARVIDHIDVVRTGRVRRAKLYYLRGLKGKAARLRERVVISGLPHAARQPCRPISLRSYSRTGVACARVSRRRRRG